MGVMDRFERRLDRLVNGVFARTFKSQVEPVEIAAALQRECDDRAAIVSRGRTMVPNAFTSSSGRPTTNGCAVYTEPLGDELSAMVREHADEQGYAFVGPVEVRFERARGPRHGAVPDRSEAKGGAATGLTMTGAPPPSPPGSRSAGARSSSPDAPPSWDAATRPTCASMTPASPGGTPRSSSATPAGSSTWGRPTARGSTTGRSPRPSSSTARGSASAARPDLPAGQLSGGPCPT